MYSLIFLCLHPTAISKHLRLVFLQHQALLRDYTFPYFSFLKPIERESADRYHVEYLYRVDNSEQHDELHRICKTTLFLIFVVKE